MLHLPIAVHYVLQGKLGTDAKNVVQAELAACQAFHIAARVHCQLGRTDARVHSGHRLYAALIRHKSVTQQPLGQAEVKGFLCLWPETGHVGVAAFDKVVILGADNRLCLLVREQCAQCRFEKGNVLGVGVQRGATGFFAVAVGHCVLHPQCLQ